MSGEYTGASTAGAGNIGTPAAAGGATVMFEHPTVIHPADHAQFSAARMGKSTLFESRNLLVGLNAFEPGQSHALHAHRGMDKVYHVLSGEGRFLLDDRDVPMRAGDLLVAPDGVPHGVHNTGAGRLVVLVVLSPGPSAK